SKPRLYAQRIVDHFGFASHFVAVYGADLEGRLDDKRALLAHLIEREGVDRSKAVMIGDRMHDIRAAKMHGVRAVGVLWGYGTRAELVAAGADELVATPAELETLLAR
ncbi:MAG TPA: HAD family hydrolase, partial [Casimicrobiaceae bacterium]|nr:HAD family hydrolase [Casimicrobiaceae bacterium]